MAHDRTGEPIDTDPAPTMFGRPDVCDRCGGHGWIDECLDAQGNVLGSFRWDPAYAHLVVREETLPCPRCSPREYTRWQAGCWRTDGSHNPAACELCIEDGRHEHRTR